MMQMHKEAQELTQVNDQELYTMCSTNGWAKLDKETRLAVFQEIENRQARLCGRRPKRICIMSPEESRPQNGGVVFGNTNEDRIEINCNFFSGMGNRLGFPAALGLGTVIHEGRHVFQMEAVAHKLLPDAPAVPELQRLRWEADMTVYTNRMPLYALQSIEQDARMFAHNKLRQITANLAKSGIVDRNMLTIVKRSELIEKSYIQMTQKVFTPELLNRIDAEKRELLARRGLTYPDDFEFFPMARVIMDNRDMPVEFLFRMLNCIRDASLGLLSKEALLAYFPGDRVKKALNVMMSSGLIDKKPELAALAADTRKEKLPVQLQPAASRQSIRMHHTL